MYSELTGYLRLKTKSVKLNKPQMSLKVMVYSQKAKTKD